MKCYKTALVLVWPDLWRSYKERQGKGQPFPTGMLSCEGKKDASASTDQVVLHAMEDAPRAVSMLFTSPMALAYSWGQLRDFCWAFACLGHFAFDSFPCITANRGCCGHQTSCFPMPWHLVLCSSCAAKGTHQHCFTLRNTTVSCECDDCAGPTTRGDVGLPGYPPIRPSLPQEDWGTTLASSAPGVCVHAADLPASLYSLHCVVGASQSQHHQPGSIMAQLLGSWEERLVRPGWDRNSLAGLCTGQTPDQHQGWLETRSLAKLLDTGTTKHSTTCHKSSTDGYFKQSWRFPMVSPALPRLIHRHNLCALSCWLAPWVGELAIQKLFQVVPAAKLVKLCIDQMSANSQYKLFLHTQMVT